ncbi:hypothetical protein ACMD2_27223, partial [Ananas comosus]
MLKLLRPLNTRDTTVLEAKLGGPIHYRWMYPIERYLVWLKSYVRNRAQPEGSNAEGHIAEE